MQAMQRDGSNSRRPSAPATQTQGEVVAKKLIGAAKLLNDIYHDIGRIDRDDFREFRRLMGTADIEMPHWAAQVSKRIYESP